MDDDDGDDDDDDDGDGSSWGMLVHITNFKLDTCMDGWMDG